MSLVEQLIVVCVAAALILGFVIWSAMLTDDLEKADESQQAIDVARLYRSYFGATPCDLPTDEIEMDAALEVVASRSERVFHFEDSTLWRIQFGEADRNLGMVSVWRIDSDSNRRQDSTVLLDAGASSKYDHDFHDALFDDRVCS